VTSLFEKLSSIFTLAVRHTGPPEDISVPVKPDLEIEWLAGLARQRVQDSASRIEQIQRRSQDRDDLAGVDLLLRMLSLMVSQSKSLIESSLRAARDSDDSGRRLELETVRNTVTQLDRAVDGAFQALTSPPERDVTALVQPYVRLARDLTRDEGTELIFESGGSYDYEVWADAFEDVREGIEIVAPSLGLTVEDLPPLALVTYPGRGDQETLLHAVIAHEVTHLGLSRKREEKGDEVNDVFDTLVVTQGIVHPRVDRLDHWLNELLADSLALSIIGPAYFFALTEYLFPTHNLDDPAYVSPRSPLGSSEEQADSHPPPVWRLERLRPEVSRFFEKRFRGLRKAEEAFHKFLELIPPPIAPEGEAEKSDRALLEEMIEKIDLPRLAGDAIYPIDRFRRDLPLVWDKLEQDIAPVERVRGRRKRFGLAEDRSWPFGGDSGQPLPATDWSQALDWRSILNGGYLHFLHAATVASPTRHDAVLRRRQDVNSLIRGSIELSELHRRMIELSEEFEVLNPPPEK
jgi:hypothetical protein